MDENKLSQIARRQAASDIVFGLDREKDEQSLAAFLMRFSSPSVIDVLIPRLKDEEIRATVDFITDLMRKHFVEEEYHRLFLR